ncbi:MAG: hypothetical protein LUE06_08020 [Oscillospiraceae bacterium]|nr:hypothetical protein [Oscillospiraceae bacterium]
MKELTVRQMEYLLLFATHKYSEAGMTSAADEFGVTKATACVTVDALERAGMITRGELGEIAPTEVGGEIIAPRVKAFHIVSGWMMEHMGLLPIRAEQAARTIVCSLDDDIIEKFLKYNNQPAAPKSESEDALLENLPYGVYTVDFEVRKKGRTELSMANAGFLKPAMALRENERSLFTLCPISITRNIRLMPKRSAILETMWYYHGDSWREAQSSPTGVTIPGYAMRFDPVRKTATVRVRMRTSISLRYMPESEADIVFFLTSCAEDEKVYL